MRSIKGVGLTPKKGLWYKPLIAMSLPDGYIAYKRREFCKDVRCPVQLDLETKPEGSPEYEEVREVCKTQCRHTTYVFHHWLIEKGYLIIRPEKS